MSEFARLRLARASRNWFAGSELACSVDAYVRRLNERGYAPRTSNIYLETSHILRTAPSEINSSAPSLRVDSKQFVHLRHNRGIRIAIAD